MNFRTTIVLVVLLLGVGAYLFFSNGKGPQPGDTVEKKSAQKVLDVSSGDVTKLTVTPADGKAVVVEKSPPVSGQAAIRDATSDWKLTAPVAAPADPVKVNDLVDAVTGATSTAEVKVAGNAADYGLDQPQFKVQVDAAGKSVKLNVGRNVKAGNELYVQVEGSDVAQVVSADLLDKLDVKPDKLRLARLVDVDSMATRSLTITRPKDPVVLDKTGEQWQMTLPTTQPANASPTTLPAEASAVTDVISALNNAQATGFADPGDNEAMLVGEPRATVTVSAQPPTTQPSGPSPADSVTIAFGSPDSLVGKNVWVRVTPGGVVATVSKETMDSVLKSPLDFRNREVVKIDPSAVTAVRVVKTVPAATQPTTRQASERDVALVRRQEQVSLTAGPLLPASPATQPSSLPTTTAATEPTTQAVAATQPVPHEPATQWQIDGPAKADADDSKVTSLLGELNPLKATKYLAAPPATKPTAAPPTTYAVTIQTAKGAPAEMVFSDPGEASADAVVGVYNGVTFEAPRSVITALDADFAKKPKP